MTASPGNPFDVYRFALIESDTDLLADLPVTDLAHRAMNGTVEKADPQYARELFAELGRRGETAWWQAADMCLAFLSANPVSGQHGEAAAAELRQAASLVPNPAARLMLEAMAAHRSGGTEAAAIVWHAATAQVREEVGRSLFLTACGAASSRSTRLTPEQMGTLAHQLLG